MKNPSRVVNVSSVWAMFCRTINFKELTTFTNDFHQYTLSKLCQIFFTDEFSRRFADSNITIYSLHPGFVNTSIFDNLWPWLKKIVDFLAKIYSKVRMCMNLKKTA